MSEMITIKASCIECGHKYEFNQETQLIDFCQGCGKPINYEKINTNLLLKLLDFFSEMIEVSNIIKEQGVDE